MLRDVLQQRGKRRVVRDAKSEGEAVANQYQFTGAVGDAAGRARPERGRTVLRGVVVMFVGALPVLGKLPAEAWMVFDEPRIHVLSLGRRAGEAQHGFSNTEGDREPCDEEATRVETASQIHRRPL